MWQKCPICEGSGIGVSMYSSGTGLAVNPTCTVCNGFKIISTVNGLPPAYAHSLSVRQEGYTSPASTLTIATYNGSGDIVARPTINSTSICFNPATTIPTGGCINPVTTTKLL